MWTLFVGLGLGVLEVLLLRKSVVMMSASKANIPLGILLSVGKLALILAVLFLIAKYISVQSMMWCAGGVAAAMIVLPILSGVSTVRRYRQEGGEE